MNTKKYQHVDVVNMCKLKQNGHAMKMFNKTLTVEKFKMCYFEYNVGSL